MVVQTHGTLSTGKLAFPAFAGRLQNREVRVAQKSHVHGVVLAGVHSWGNFVLDHAIPRPLIPVAARPLIEHSLMWLQGGGIASASICANSETATLRRQLGHGRSVGVALDYYEDVMPRGPAGCTHDAVAYNDASLFVVSDATIVPQVDLTDLLAAHERSRAALTVVVMDAGRGQGEPGAAWEPAGIYVMSRSALECIPAEGYQDVKESLIPRLYASGKSVLTYRVDGSSAPRVNSIASYMSICAWMVERLGVLPEELAGQGYVNLGQAWVHEGAEVDPSVRFVGPSLVEPGCRLEAGALVVGPTVCGPGVQIEAGAVVSRSVLWSQARVGGGATVDRVVLTDGASVPPRTTIRNAVRLAETVELSWLERLARIWRPWVGSGSHVQPRSGLASTVGLLAPTMSGCGHASLRSPVSADGVPAAPGMRVTSHE